MLLLLLLLSCFSRVHSVRPHRQQPTRLPHPWDSPGKNNGVGCHFLLQCRKVKSESEVAQSCLTLSDPMDCSLPVSSIHGIFQAKVLEWGAIAFSIIKRLFSSSSLSAIGVVLSIYTHTYVRRKWQPTPLFLPGESQGQGSLVGCRLWGHTESDMTEAT